MTNAVLDVFPPLSVSVFFSISKFICGNFCDAIFFLHTSLVIPNSANRIWLCTSQVLISHVVSEYRCILNNVELFNWKGWKTFNVVLPMRSFSFSSFRLKHCFKVRHVIFHIILFFADSFCTSKSNSAKSYQTNVQKHFHKMKEWENKRIKHICTFLRIIIKIARFWISQLLNIE